MQPLDTFGLIINAAVLVMMPVIIWANVSKAAASNPFNAYLWAEHPAFMRVSVLILGLLTLYSATALLGHFGVLSGSLTTLTSIAIGIPFLVAAVAEIVLAVRAVLKVMRGRRTAAPKS